MFPSISEIQPRRVAWGDNMLHVKRKMKENNGKLKKLEASLIKIPQSFSW